MIGRQSGMSLSRRDLAMGAAGSLALLAGRAGAQAPLLPGDVRLLLSSKQDAATFTLALQSAIDDLSRAKGGVISLSAGMQEVLPFTLRDSVIIRGAGRGASQLLGIGPLDGPLVTLAAGPQRYVGLESLSLAAKQPSPDSIGLLFESAAAPAGKPHGGLWWSRFADLEIRGYGHGLVLLGGIRDYLLPHQFITFERIFISGPGTAIRIDGQVNQTRFRDCMFGRTGEALDSALIALGNAPVTGNNVPKLLTFEQCTIQGVELAINAAGLHGLNVEGSWFENNGVSIQAAATTGLVVRGCRFANAGASGAAIMVDDLTGGVVENNVFAGPSTKAAVGGTGTGNLVATNNYAIWGGKI